MVDLTGMTFGRLKVVERVETPPGVRRRSVYWSATCICGKTVVTAGDALREKRTLSCGCYRKQMTGPRVRTHGMTKTVEYRTWFHMRERCEKATHPSYANYGGRGIRVCERWMSFKNFFADMGRRPSPKHSIDRIDNDGNYEPGNCRWATAKQQMSNQRRSQKKA